MKIMQGTVVSLKSPQTAKVSVVRQWQHPLYKKSVTRSKNYLCHYEDVQIAAGDQVVIQETRPISKLKHFKVIKKVEVSE